MRPVLWVVEEEEVGDAQQREQDEGGADSLAEVGALGRVL